jgi:apolipoprotein N-acyltransferase
VRQSIARGQAARIDGKVPLALPPTLFARFGNIVSLGWSVVVLVAAMVATRRRRG